MKNFYIITFFMLGNTCFKKCTVVKRYSGPQYLDQYLRSDLAQNIS
ncbi:hypothetical protein [uncultured Gammaproteobacteria bacterium]|nr:hypothetical protein [uncultured Gammaproteobacteria bacterium]